MHVLFIHQNFPGQFGRIAYGGDARFTQGKIFKQWFIDNNSFDLLRIHFVGRVTPTELVNIFSLSDVHCYLTVPFTLSWSLFNAFSCGALVIGSDTAPVRELVQPGENGLLVDFFDVDTLLSARSFGLWFVAMEPAELLE